MTKNKLLNITIYLCKTTQGAIILLFILLTIGFIHFQMDRSYYKNFNLDFEKANLNFKSVYSWGSANLGNDADSLYTLDKMTTISFYRLYLQFIFILVFLFLVIREFGRIIRSVKTLHTFQEQNIQSLRRIGAYLFVVVILSSFNVLSYEQASMRIVKISFAPLLLTLFSFIMAEIFREGHALKKDNDLTI